MNLQEQLRATRLTRGYSQAKLAELADLSKQHYESIERGRVNPRPATLARIEDALGVEFAVTVKPKGDSNRG